MLEVTGRVTTVLECPAVKEETAAGTIGTSVGHEAFSICRKADEYTITVDTHGKILWKSNEADGYPVISIVTEDVSKEYLDSDGSRLSWIASGKGHIDLRRAVEILNEEFGVSVWLSLAGGAYLRRIRRSRFGG